MEMLHQMGGTRVASSALEDATIELTLPQSFLGIIKQHGTVGCAMKPQNVQCELRGCNVVLTWLPPGSSSALVVTYAVQRSVGGAEFEQVISDLEISESATGQYEEEVSFFAGQELRYRVYALDRNAMTGAWSAPVKLQLPNSFAAIEPKDAQENDF